MSFKMLDNLGQTSPEIVEPVGPAPLRQTLARDASIPVLALTTFFAVFGRRSDQPLNLRLGQILALAQLAVFRRRGG
jgi:hypothetical protein